MPGTVIPFRTASLANPSTSAVFDTWAYKARATQDAPQGAAFNAQLNPFVSDAQRAKMFPNDRVFLTSVDGTLGVGGTLVIESSDDNSSYSTALTVTALQTGVYIMLGGVSHRFWRARVTAGDGTTALLVSLVAVNQD